MLTEAASGLKTFARLKHAAPQDPIWAHYITELNCKVFDAQLGLGHLKEATSAFAACRRALADNAADSSKPAKSRQSLAEAYAKLGYLADRTGKKREAAKLWKSGLEAYAALEKSPGQLDEEAQRFVADLKKRLSSTKH